MKLTIILHYISILFNNFASVLLTPILIGGLGEEQYGIYTLVFSTILYFGMAEFGIGNVIVNYVAKYLKTDEREQRENFLYYSLWIFIGIAAVAAVLLTVINLCAHLIFSGNQNWTPELIGTFRAMFTVMIINTVLVFFQTFFFCIIAGYERFVFPRSFILVRLVLRMTLIIVFMAQKHPAIYIYYMELVFTAITAAAFAFYVFVVLKQRIRRHKNINAGVRTILKHTVWSYMFTVLENTYWNISHLIVGACVSIKAAAIFAIVNTFCIVFTQLTGTIGGYFIPGIMRMIVDRVSDKKITEYVISIGRILLMPMALVYAGFAFFGKEFLTTWMQSTDFTAGDYNAMFFITLFIFSAQLFPQVMIIGDTVVQTKDKYAARALIALCATVSCAVISYLFINNLGLEFSFAGLVITILVFKFFITAAYFQRNGMNMILFAKQVYTRMIIVLAAVAVPGYLLYNWQTGSIVMFGVKIMIFVAVYAVCLWAIYLDKFEKATVKGKLKGLISS